MWSLGVCLFAMLSGFFPVQGAIAADPAFSLIAEEQRRPAAPRSESCPPVVPLGGNLWLEAAVRGQGQGRAVLPSAPPHLAASLWPSRRRSAGCTGCRSRTSRTATGP